ncbi:hypothetical protein SPPR111872_12810 [Sphingobacterium prati]
MLIMSGELTKDIGGINRELSCYKSLNYKKISSYNGSF